MKKITLALILSGIPFLAGSHIGSPGVSFEGKAGEYAVMVLINPPDVIPGTASVDIYAHASGIRAMWAKPVYWFAGDEGTPQADEMLPVTGEPGHFRGLIWLMDAGSSGIEIEVSGESGTGKIMVPVMAVSTLQKNMDSSLGWMLSGLCLLLVILMITIISASVSDGLIKPYDTSNKNTNRRRWIGAGVSAVLLLAILWNGKIWWDGWAQDYKRFMYKPFTATTSLVRDSAQNNMIFFIDTAKFSNLRFTRNISYIIPDHGKLMHMFMVRAGSMDVFAHLHPKRKDSVTFVSAVPPLPSGKYLIFADITRISGFSETIPDTIEIVEEQVLPTDASLDSSRLGPDDTYFFTNPISKSDPTLRVSPDIMMCGKPGISVPLADGSTITWEHDPSKSLAANNLYSLRFNVLDKAGRPATLEPYLGMTGHAVVMKDDGSVYIHLHPVGSYSMASQQTILARFENEVGAVNISKMPKSTVFMDSVNAAVARLEAMPEDDRNRLLTGNMNHTPDPEHPEHSVVSFPYAFPTPGHYRIWIQLKRNGKILNSAFDAEVR